MPPATPPLAACPGCGLVAGPAPGAGLTHPCIGASPGCWARYAELSVMGVAPPGALQLLVDAYAVQHPGVPERRAVQSVAVHLVSLCAVLERGWPPHGVPGLLQRAVEDPPGWRWLDPDPPLGSVTVDDLAAVTGPAERGRRVRAYAEDLWGAYAAHHATVRG